MVGRVSFTMVQAAANPVDVQNALPGDMAVGVVAASLDEMLRVWPVWGQSGLPIHLVCLPLDVHRAQDAEQVQQAVCLLEQVAGRAAGLGLSLISSSSHDRPSAPRADSRAAGLIRQLLKPAAQQQVRLMLMPQRDCWMARVEDATRLGMRVNHPQVGLLWDGRSLTWDSPAGLQSRLHLALPRLWSLILPDPVDGPAAGLLHQTAVGLGYQGPVGRWG